MAEKIKILEKEKHPDVKDNPCPYVWSSSIFSLIFAMMMLRV
jgi:hypothetical protein